MSEQLCKEHRDYTATLPPRVGCAECIYAWIRSKFPDITHFELQKLATLIKEEDI